MWESRPIEDDRHSAFMRVNIKARVKSSICGNVLRELTTKLL